MITVPIHMEKPVIVGQLAFGNPDVAITILYHNYNMDKKKWLPGNKEIRSTWIISDPEEFIREIINFITWLFP